MAIKKLFDSANKITTYSDYKSQKQTYDSVESVDNANQLFYEQQTYIPDVDYTKPKNFAMYGSAYYYYKGAIDKISDFYPYDGSKAEQNTFYNDLLPVERYIFNKEYPRTTGYATLSKYPEGLASAAGGGYGLPSTLEYITFKGGPNTGSSKNVTLAEKMVNPAGNNLNKSNIYDTDIYTSEGLPTDYDQGTRLSNLQADFDKGVTVEFWMKSGSIRIAGGAGSKYYQTDKQVVFDWWNQEPSSSSDYGRILLEVTAAWGELDGLSTPDGASEQERWGRPFVVTVLSGATSTRNVITLGTSSLHNDFGSWHHYAISMFNTGSSFKTRLYVDGALNETADRGMYSLTSSFQPFPGNAKEWHTYGEKFAVSGSFKTGPANLAGWWRLNSLTNGIKDKSGNKKDGVYIDSDRTPDFNTTLTPSKYIQSTTGSLLFDNTSDSNKGDAIKIGLGAEWNKIIGALGTKQMTFAAWVRKTGDGGTNVGRIIDFSNSIMVYTNALDRVIFVAKLNSSLVAWRTAAGVLPDPSGTPDWAHVVVTYDGRDSDSNDPIAYVNGVRYPMANFDGTKHATFDGIAANDCLIGNSYLETRGWKGSIADVAVWDTILPQQQIQTIYSAKRINQVTLTVGALKSKNAMGRLGALQTDVSGMGAGHGGTITSGSAGAGKLSGSIDEFRFWKVKRNSAQIAENYFVPVGGGANTDISNTTLGIYYKFNEGITGTSSVDSIVLDYAGRMSNAAWTGYTSTARNTGSAMVSASAALYEYADPIIRTNHPDYKTLRTRLLHEGEFYDSQNNSAFINYAPSWILEEHEDLGNTNLKIISHIVGSYFDKLYLMTQEFPKFKHVNFVSASASPLPFASHLPASLGLYVPEIFVDATLKEMLLNRTDSEQFESSVNDAKNLIYQNLYNNLAEIFKAKGTEQGFKNVLRCFNIDDDLVRLKIYSNRNTYELNNNLKQIISKNTTVNFNDPLNTNAVVYQRKNTANPDSSGYISGSWLHAGTHPYYEIPYGFTAEADVVFPRFFSLYDTVNRAHTQISLFGLNTVETGSTAHLNGTKTTWAFPDKANFQVYAVRDEEGSKNVYFKLESGRASYESKVPFPTLTSSIFNQVYNNQRWNLSVRLKTKNPGVSGLVTGSSQPSYELVFRGVAATLGAVTDSFEVSASVGYLSGAHFLTAPKRMYAGAYRTNITGATLYNSDVRISNVKYWTKFIENGSLNLHVYDSENSGVSGSYLNVLGLDPDTNPYDITNQNTLALEWNYDNIASSDGSGNFTVQDFSSGSSVIRDNYGWVGDVAGYQHDGYGYGFGPSSTKISDKTRQSSYKFSDPEEVVSDNMINILSEDDTMFEIEQTVPTFVISAEKSMYQAISEEILIFLAGAVDFNNLIGEPVNRYRMRYKAMENLRQAFFQRVSSVQQVEKFVNYYKWFDEAITEIFKQLTPASAEIIDGVSNIVESHVLERNKYKTPFPTIETKQPDPDGVVYGSAEAGYIYDMGSTTMAASPRPTNKHIPFWKTRAIRSSTEITSGDAVIDAQRETFRKVINSVPTLSTAAPIVTGLGTGQYNPKIFERRNFPKNYNFIVDKPNQGVIRGGVNFDHDKNLEFARTALYPDGPVDQNNGRYVPQNILLSFISDFTDITNFKDRVPTPNQKTKRYASVLYGRHSEGPDSFYKVRSSRAFPFNIISSSIASGYQAHVQQRLGLNLEITNLHNDVYGDDMEKPMQGPFTEAVVGGLQSRHVPLNNPTNGLDDCDTRPEAWKILLGTCLETLSGAIGMVGPDYPPAHYMPGAGEKPYPYTRAPMATKYRDFIAKSPVNFKNIKITGSNVLGNYVNSYEILHTFGAYSNPRNFVEKQPVLPSNVIQSIATSSTSVRTFLDIQPVRSYNLNTQRFAFVQDYDVSYLTGTTNKSVIKTRFSAPGGIETMTPGYTDFRSDEFSVYNSTTYKNLSVIRPYQGPSGTLAKADGAINSATGIRVQDIHNEDYGLRSHLARHTARFGRDSVHVPTPPGATYDELPGFHKVHRNTLRRMKAVYSPTSEVTGFTTGSEFDNYFVQHQIPRSTKQYSWIAATVEGDNRISGFVPRNFHYSTSAGTVDAYTFATGSSFGSYMVSGVRKFGADKKEKPNNSNIVGFLPTVSRLNLNVLDPLTASTNMLGNPLSSEISSYRGPQVAQFSAAPAQASLFNALMIKRSGFFGYPTWRRIRAAQESPIMNHHHKNNKIPIYDPESGTNILYTVPPLSMRDRAHRISLRQNDGTSMLLRAEHRNEYFNTVALDNKLGMRTGPTPLTPLTSVILAAYNSKDIANINYLVYTENIFPSARNEFMSHSTQRLNYSSNFWHSTRAERNSLNAEFIPSGTVNDYATFPIHKGRKNSFGLYTSQSAWPLDAPTNFLERTGAYGTPSDFQPTPFTPLKTLNANVPIYVPWIVSGNAGELQNTYNSYFSMGRGYPLSGAYPHDMFSGRRTRLANALAGPLYSRKQMLASPLSVTKPTGIYVARAGRVLASSTGSQVAGGFQRMPWGVSGSWPYSISQYSASIYTGEALWEAGVKAGITKKTGSTYQFVAAPSIPFYDSYDQYRGDLKFLARGYSIVPEYRISRNLEEYVENDSPFVSGKTDHFEIPGTTINSSQSGFYIDYSNSEFLKHFAEIRDSSGLNPAEVRLVVSASLKFMPYEGFYPAQRTMDLVKRFSDSYGETFDSSVTGQDGTTKQTFTGKDLFKTVPGAARSVIQPLFAPGILYNTIKSGIAVDYPVLFSDNKMIRSLNYSDGGIINPYTTKRCTGSIVVASGIVGHNFTSGEAMLIHVPQEFGGSVIVSSSINIDGYGYTGSTAFVGFGSSAVSTGGGSTPSKTFADRLAGAIGLMPSYTGTGPMQVYTTDSTTGSTVYIKQRNLRGRWTKSNYPAMSNSRDAGNNLTVNACRYNGGEGVWRTAKTTFPISQRDTLFADCLLAPKLLRDVTSSVNTPAARYLQPNTASVTEISDLDQGFGTFWDKRLDFETIINPNLAANLSLADLEPALSASIIGNSTKYGVATDKLYTLMSRNFFGGIADFYLKDSEFTSLRSGIVYKDDLQFRAEDIYMARVKMRRSMTGSRVYTYESGTFDLGAYHPLGGKAYTPRLLNPTDTLVKSYKLNEYYEIPQDPMNAPGLLETFTMYSRPTAFGPPIAGHPGNTLDLASQISTTYNFDGSNHISPYTASYFTGWLVNQKSSSNNYQIMDSLTGYNWSFTPPYYDGEAWVDLIFRPSGSVPYTLEKILAETKTVCWRVDPGPKITHFGRAFGGTNNQTGQEGVIGFSGSVVSQFVSQSNIGASGQGYSGSYTPSGDRGNLRFTTLLHDPQFHMRYTDSSLTQFGGTGVVNITQSMAIYGGSSINGHAMQATASLNLFGIENVFKKTDSSSGEKTSTNEIIGKRWVIQTKFETPMLNFNDTHGIRPVSSSNNSKTMPTHYGAEPAPNGMWHQFGEISKNKNTGVFIEIEDMSSNWLKNHYMVRNSGSVYNDNTADLQGALSKPGQVKSFKDLFNYKEENTSARVGELKNKLTVKEAIVAVPYVISNTNQNSEKVLSSPTGKEFFKLPKSTVNAALSDSDGAGSSIRRQILLMQDYVLPPQFDFLSFPDEISPIVMYFFEFKHDFDRDDLSYMWQNLMPRNYDQIKLQTATCEHVLHKYELMSQDDLTNNENLRWMIFKVKQRRQSNYYDYVANQYGKGSSIGTLAPRLGQSAADIKQITNRSRDADLTPQQRYMQYNWPYDFFSIIESIKIDTEALYKNTSGLVRKYGGSLSMGSAVIPDQKPWQEYGIETMGGEGSFWDPPGDVGSGGTWRPPIGSTSADDEEEKKAAEDDAGTEEETDETPPTRWELIKKKYGDLLPDPPDPEPGPEDLPKDDLPKSGGGISLPEAPGVPLPFGGKFTPGAPEGHPGGKAEWPLGGKGSQLSTAAYESTGIYSMGPSPMRTPSRKAKKKKY